MHDDENEYYVVDGDMLWELGKGNIDPKKVENPYDLSCGRIWICPNCLEISVDKLQEENMEKKERLRAKFDWNKAMQAATLLAKHINKKEGTDYKILNE